MTDFFLFQNIFISTLSLSVSSFKQDTAVHSNLNEMSDYLNIDSNKSDFFYFDSESANTQYHYQNILNTSLINFDAINSLNATTKSKLLMSPSLTVLFGVLSGIMSLSTILGNILVITAFIIDKNLRSYSNYFILNLSIADLLIGILIPPYAPFLLGNRRWLIGRTACTLWLVLDYVVGSASVLCIVVISLDRYLLVSGGLSYVSKQKVSKAICIMATVWIIAFINYAPAIVFWELISGKSTVADDDCQVQFHDNLPYLTATACVEFFVPLISICSLNLAVYLNIRKRSKGLIRSKNPKFGLKNETNDNNNKAIALNNNTNNQKVNSNDEEATAANPIKKVNVDINRKILIPNTPSISDVSSDNAHGNNGFANSSSASSAANNNNNSHKLCESEKEPNNPPQSNNNINILQNTLLSVKMPLLKPTGTKKGRQVSAKSSLSKDKKAARSLFILVFVFVCCWVSFIHELVKAYEIRYISFIRICTC